MKFLSKRQIIKIPSEISLFYCKKKQALFLMYLHENHFGKEARIMAMELAME